MSSIYSWIQNLTVKKPLQITLCCFTKKFLHPKVCLCLEKIVFSSHIDKYVGNMEFSIQEQRKRTIGPKKSYTLEKKGFMLL